MSSFTPCFSKSLTDRNVLLYFTLNFDETDLLDLNHLVGVAIHGHVEGGHDEAALLPLCLFLLTSHQPSASHHIAAHRTHARLRNVMSEISGSRLRQRERRM